MRIRSRLLTALAGTLLAVSTVAAHAQALEQGRLLLATQVLNDLKGTRDQGIPQWLLKRAYAIAVIPGLTKVAFFFGGRFGHGVLVARTPSGGFSSPVFVTLAGGSFGFQWGVQKTDLVLVFTSRKGVAGLSGGKVTLGADVSVAAGPVGREASASTVQTFNAAVYSYSHNKGLFAGVSVNGAVLRADDTADAEFYDHPHVRVSQILSGAVISDNSAATGFVDALNVAEGVAAGPEAVSAAAPVAGPQPKRAPAAQAFPLQDQHPGSNPPSGGGAF